MEGSPFDSSVLLLYFETSPYQLRLNRNVHGKSGPRYHPGFFSQERITYLPEPVESLKVERESRIIYHSKGKGQEKPFDALDCLAAMTSHISNHGEQMVRYYGFYSNVFRGLGQKENRGALIPLPSMEILSE